MMVHLADEFGRIVFLNKDGTERKVQATYVDHSKYHLIVKSKEKVRKETVSRKRFKKRSKWLH